MDTSTAPVFICPTCGEIEEQDVAFVCNTCETSEAKHIDGIYLCSKCEKMAHPLECRICGNTNVLLKSPHIKLPKTD